MPVALDTLAYAQRLREAGVSEQLAHAHAHALAAAMTDTLATKQDLRELEAHIDARMERIDARFAQVDGRFAKVEDRFDYLEKHLDTRLAEQETRNTIRLVELEKRVELRLQEQTAILRGETADLERRLTVRLGGIMLAGVSVVSALVKIL